VWGGLPGGGAADPNGVQVSHVQSREQTNYPLMLAIAPGPRLDIMLGYDGGRFDGKTVRRLLKHYGRVLETLMARPGQLVSEVQVLSEQEQHQLVVEWNYTYRDFPRNQCFHQLFEAQSERTPESVAVACAGQQVSYLELNRRATQVAVQLVAHGVAAEKVVALLLERGHGLITAVLAVFKAGGAYLPLDPLWPADRMADVVMKSGSRLLLTSRSQGTGLARACQRHGSSEPELMLWEELDADNYGQQFLESLH